MGWAGDSSKPPLPPQAWRPPAPLARMNGGPREAAGQGKARGPREAVHGCTGAFSGIRAPDECGPPCGHWHQVAFPSWGFHGNQTVSEARELGEGDPL